MTVIHSPSPFVVRCIDLIQLDQFSQRKRENCARAIVGKRTPGTAQGTFSKARLQTTPSANLAGSRSLTLKSHPVLKDMRFPKERFREKRLYRGVSTLVRAPPKSSLRRGAWRKLGGSRLPAPCRIKVAATRRSNSSGVLSQSAAIWAPTTLRRQRSLGPDAILKGDPSSSGGSCR